MSATGAKLGWLGRQPLPHERFGRAALHERVRVLERGRRDGLRAVARLHAGDVHGRRAHVRRPRPSSSALSSSGARRQRRDAAAREWRARDPPTRPSRVRASFSSSARERRAHRRLHALDRRPAPARERLRLADDGEDAGHVRLRGLRAGPAHFVEAALSGVAARREVDVAVRPDLEIGDRHRLAVHELGEIFAAAIRRARRRQRRVEQAAARPVGLEQVVEERRRDTRSSGRSRRRPAIRGAGARSAGSTSKYSSWNLPVPLR